MHCLLLRSYWYVELDGKYLIVVFGCNTVFISLYLNKDTGPSILRI